MWSSKTGRKTSNVASAVWHVAPSCWNQLFPISSNFCEQKFVQYGLITIAIDCNGLSLFVFEEKLAQLWLWTKIRTKQWLVFGASAFQCMSAGVLCPKCYNFSCLHTRQNQKDDFFPKISIFCKSIAFPLPSVYTTIFVRRKDKTNYLSNQTWAKCYHSRNNCYADKPATIDELKGNIRETTIDNVLKNCTDRVRYCMASQSRHLNEIIFHY